jgi:hypothetical protein
MKTRRWRAHKNWLRVSGPVLDVLRLNGAEHLRREATRGVVFLPGTCRNLAARLIQSKYLSESWGGR